MDQVRDELAVRTGGVAPTWLRRIFLINLIVQTGIIVTGATVRVTASGLGCPTWPECTDGSIVPTSAQAEAWHKYVEFGNRLLTVVLVVAAIAALVGAIAWARSRRAKDLRPRRPITVLSAVPLLGTVAQALLGGVTVLTGLNPVTVAAHFLLSMTIVAGCVVLLWRAGEPGDQPVTTLVRREVLWLGTALVALAAIVVALGTVVTGSGPHSGDSADVGRLPIDPRMASWLHADVVLLFVGLIVAAILALRLTDSPVQAQRASWWLAGAAVLQGVIGYVQYFTGLPEVLVLLHVLGACLVWIAVLRLRLSLRSRGLAPNATQVEAQAGTGHPISSGASGS